MKNWRQYALLSPPRPVYILKANPHALVSVSEITLLYKGRLVNTK